MKDRKLKRAVIINDFDRMYRQNQFKLFTGEDYIPMDWLTPDEERVCINLNQARYKRIRRAKRFITNQIILPSYFDDYKAVFLTLTFNDDTLDNTTELARRKRVRRYLNQISYNYIANIDFGTKNEREHYHACVLLKEDANLEKWSKNGFYLAKDIAIDIKENTSPEKLAKYINKLTYHAFKDSTTHIDCSYRSIYYQSLQ